MAHRLSSLSELSGYITKYEFIIRAAQSISYIHQANTILNLDKMMRHPGHSLTTFEEEILQVCGHGTVAELVVLLDQLRAESTKLQDYRPDEAHGHFVP